MTREQLEKLYAIGKKIEHYWEIERYTDPDGVVWVGIGEAPDEVWVSGVVSDDVLSKQEMMKKMCKELMHDFGHPQEGVLL